MDFQSQASGIGSLADETRRSLYEFVISQGEPVSRDQAAEAVGIARHNVNFHLDRLVDEGLLDVEYRRLSGRTGPGAGRPSKLYKRGEREFSVSLPERHYDLVGDILATAVTRADGRPIADVVKEVAYSEGQRVGASAPEPAAGEPLEIVSEVLSTQGYEPQERDGLVVLNNCPFDSLAAKHTDLVCGLNVDYVQGLADGLGAEGVQACLEPGVGRCCVTLKRLRDHSGAVNV